MFEDGGSRAENVLEDGLRPAQSLDLMRTGLRHLVVSLPTYNLARISPPLRGAALWRPQRCSPAGCPARTRGMRPSVDSSMAPGHILGQPSARSLGIGCAGQVDACTRIDTRSVVSRAPRSRRPSSMRDSGSRCRRILPWQYRLRKRLGPS